MLHLIIMEETLPVSQPVEASKRENHYQTQTDTTHKLSISFILRDVEKEDLMIPNLYGVHFSGVCVYQINIDIRYSVMKVTGLKGKCMKLMFGIESWKSKEGYVQLLPLTGQNYLLPTHSDTFSYLY